MMPLLLLNGDATFDAGPDGPVDRDAFLAEVPDIVPACVAGIHEFWQNYQKPPSQPEVEASQEAADASDAADRDQSAANFSMAPSRRSLEKGFWIKRSRGSRDCPVRWAGSPLIRIIRTFGHRWRA